MMEQMIKKKLATMPVSQIAAMAADYCAGVTPEARAEFIRCYNERSAQHGAPQITVMA